MLSSFASGRVLFVTSQRNISSHLKNYTLQTNKFTFKSIHNVHSNNIANQQAPKRFFSKTNACNARLGVREQATPKVVTPEFSQGVHGVGMLSLAVAGSTGIIALCYYGLGLSNVEGALERSVLWPDYVRDRVRSTYSHFGVGFGISGLAAYATMNSPAMMNLMSRGSILFTVGTIAAMMASGTLVRSLPYEKGFGPKQLAWVGHCALLGSILAPISVLGGPAILRAATYTAGIVGGLTAIAVCAPSERFLINSAPISISLGALVASSVGSMFLSPTSRIGLGLYGFSLYGGLIIFSGLLLYDTQKMIKRAEMHPTYSMAPYDPINNSMSLYLDTLNIFIRILTLSGQRKK